MILRFLSLFWSSGNTYFLACFVAMLAVPSFAMQQSAPLPIITITEAEDDYTGVNKSPSLWTDFNKKIAMLTAASPKKDIADAVDFLDGLDVSSEVLSNIPLSDLRTTVETITKAHNKISSKPLSLNTHKDVPLTLHFGLHNFFDWLLPRLGQEYRSRIKVNFSGECKLYEKYEKEDQAKFLRRVNNLSCISQDPEVFNFLLATEIKNNNIPQIKNYLKRAPSILNTHIFNNLIASNDYNTIVQVGLHPKLLKLCTDYVRTLPHTPEERIPFYKALKKVDTVALKKSLATAQSDEEDARYLLSHTYVMQDRLDEATALFRKKYQDRYVGYDYKGYSQLIKDFLRIDFLHTSMIELLQNWYIYCYGEDESLLTALEKNGLMSLIGKSSGPVQMQYAAALGQLYTRAYCESPENEHLKQTARFFLSLVKPEDKPKFTPSPWKSLVTSQNQLLLSLYQDASKKLNAPEMLAFSTEGLAWEYADNFSPVFFLLPDILKKKGTYEVVLGMRELITQGEKYCKDQPDLLYYLGRLSWDGLSGLLNQKNIYEDQATFCSIVPEDRGKAISFYKQAAEHGLEKAHYVLGAIAEAKGELEEALEHYGYCKDAQGLLKYAHMSTKLGDYANAEVLCAGLIIAAHKADALSVVPAAYFLRANCMAENQREAEKATHAYVLADLIKKALYHADVNAASLGSVISDKVHATMAAKAESVFTTKDTSSDAANFLATYAIYTLINEQNNAKKAGKEVDAYLLMTLMKYAAYSANLENPLGHAAMGCVLIENLNRTKNEKMPLRYFESMYKAYQQSEDPYAQKMAVDQIYTLADKGNVCAQAILIGSSTHDLNSLTAYFWWKNPVLFNDLLIERDTAAFLRTVLFSDEDTLVLLHDFAVNPENPQLSLQLFLFNIFYGIGTSILRHGTRSISDEFTAMDNLEWAAALGENIVKNDYIVTEMRTNVDEKMKAIKLIYEIARKE
jgi:hypothetical protein